ncbi:MAG: ABC transporter ATP-binding protein [Phycisphaerales bacterium]|nr:ferrichrome ABC transporter ATP-binding protein [Planctomycetaceae bacterium]MDP7573580.1 ABC transporter ATP-binding protein [Phycisphaerales bacterium]HCA38586.1 ABC transporter ATP-binding protein [Phycisphaerales bacterium]
MLRCKDMMVTRGDFTLGPIEAEANPGEVTAVIGPNASGKTTLLEAVAGITGPSAGVVNLDGVDLHQRSITDRAACVAMLPQRPASDLSLSVERLAELGRLRLSASAETIEAALVALDLTAIRQRPVCTLSVGQAQRAHLARLWAQRNDSSLLVLDEPTAPLDHRWADAVWDMLASHARSGGTVVVAVHDLAVAADRADRVWLLQDGCLAHAASACDVLQPDMLSEVFGTQFEWVTRRDGSRWLVKGSGAA